MSTSVWVGYPRSYTPGRARAVQFITLHYTAGSEGPTSAESGAQYDKTRTDGTSCHYFADSQGLPCQEVPDGDRSHSALWHGNEIGIHIEICGTKQTREQWLDKTSKATLEYTAALVADLCKRHNIPVKRLSVDETRRAYYAASGSRPKGINDHNACTKAFPEDGGTHTDVGSDFPWDVFMDMVEGNMSPEETANAVWHVDGEPAINNQYYPWRTDSPAHEPPPAKPNLWITAGSAMVENANRANLAYETALKAVELCEEILRRLPSVEGGGTFEASGEITLKPVRGS